MKRKEKTLIRKCKVNSADYWLIFGRMKLSVNIISETIRDYKDRFYSIGRYFLASLVPLILNLVSNPLVAQNMSAEDYAIVGYFKSYNALILPIVLFYILHYYTKRFYEIDEERREELKAYIFKFLFTGSFLSTIISIGGIYIYTYFFNKESQIPLFPYVWISLMSLPLTGIYALTLTEYKMAQQSKRFLIISVAYSVITVASLLIFVVVFKQGAFGILFSTFFANLLLFIYCTYINRGLFGIRVSIKNYKEILKFCAPLTLAATLGFFTNGYDRVYLERLGEIKELGYYIVAFSICNYLTVFADAVGNTFQPDLFKAIANRSMKSFAKYTLVVLATNALIVAVFIPLSPIIVGILTADKYVYSALYMRVLAVSSFASTIYYVVSQFTVAVGMIKVILYNKILTSILSVLMFKLLIDNYTFMGAAWGVSLSFIISTLGNILLLYIYKSQLRQHWLNTK